VARDELIERFDRHLARSDELMERIERRMELGDKVIERNTAAFERFDQSHERLLDAVSALSRTVADLAEQTRAHTEAVFALLDRFGPAEGRT
jgi:methyl-accepting chemotaxis protein